MIDARSAMLGRPVREDELEPISYSMATLGRTVPMVELAKANNLFNAAAITFEHFLDEQGIDLILIYLKLFLILILKNLYENNIKKMKKKKQSLLILK